MTTTRLVRIPNHVTGSMSDLEMAAALHVPPGGNWKNIPETIPSARLANIRSAFAAGKGSRSTYYGRLHPDRPAYTISTYFTRLGNGCHLHYDFAAGQHRTLSLREAARLQSFPDSFRFVGSKTSVANQIGNAVPPLLGYLIAKRLGRPGQFIDLFAGAGGLALGFLWAGWKPVVANDVDATFLATYTENIDPNVVAGDIRDVGIQDSLIEAVQVRRMSKPLWVIGGPPCQGFSTAGNARSMDDERNHLFRDYIKVIEALDPDGFVFENVTGLLNMQGGRVFEEVRGALAEHCETLSQWKPHAEQFGVPQRRSRVVLVGSRRSVRDIKPPEPLTSMPSEILSTDDALPPAVSVFDALDDLPALGPSEDGSLLEYRHGAISEYQRFMRGAITAKDYVTSFKRTRAAG